MDWMVWLAGVWVAIVAGSFIAVALVQEKGLSLFYNNKSNWLVLIASSLRGVCWAFLVFIFIRRKFYGRQRFLVPRFLVGCIAVIGALKPPILAVLIVPFLLVAIPIMICDAGLSVDG